ncbi:MAG: hypothetical protein ACHREM_27305 [Polyangiales bacterium]
MTTSSSLTDRALSRAGLADVLVARLDATRADAARSELESVIDRCDALLLGAMADRVRGVERGDAVRIYLDSPIGIDTSSFRFVAPSWRPTDGGLAFVRAVAAARLLSPSGVSLVVDVARVGIQLAQLALAWGADAWIVKLDALTIQVAEDEEDHDAQALVALGKGPAIDDAERAILKERELAGLVRQARRHPRIVERRGVAELEREVDETTVAKRRFRAPGREVAELRATRGE